MGGCSQTYESAGKVSIIIPVYNVEAYLAEALQSVQAQTYGDWECLCVDDGSTDESAKIVQDFAGRDMRFRLISQPNQGPGAARNKGISSVQGEFLLFMDADDILHPGLMAACVRRLEEDDSDMCIYGMSRFCRETPAGISAPYFFGMPETGDCGYACFTPVELGFRLFTCASTFVFTRFFRTRHIKDEGVRYLALKHWEEVPVCLVPMALAKRISFMRQVFYFYRTGRAGSLTTHVALWDSEVCDGYQATWDMLRQRGRLATCGVPLLLRFLLATEDFYSRGLSLSLTLRSYRRISGMCRTMLAELRDLSIPLDAETTAELATMRRKFRRTAHAKAGRIVLSKLGMEGVARSLYRKAKAVLRCRRD